MDGKGEVRRPMGPSRRCRGLDRLPPGSAASSWRRGPPHGCPVRCCGGNPRRSTPMPSTVREETGASSRASVFEASSSASWRDQARARSAAQSPGGRQRDLRAHPGSGKAALSRLRAPERKRPSPPSGSRTLDPAVNFDAFQRVRRRTRSGGIELVAPRREEDRSTLPQASKREQSQDEWLEKRTHAPDRSPWRVTALGRKPWRPVCPRSRRPPPRLAWRKLGSSAPWSAERPATTPPAIRLPKRHAGDLATGPRPPTSGAGGPGVRPDTLTLRLRPERGAPASLRKRYTLDANVRPAVVHKGLENRSAPRRSTSGGWTCWSSASSWAARISAGSTWEDPRVRCHRVRRLRRSQRGPELRALRPRLSASGR